MWIYDGSTWELAYSNDHVKAWADVLGASKTTSIFQREFLTLSKAGSLVEKWVRTKQPRNQNKPWAEGMAGSKSTDYSDVENIVRAKTAALSEAWDLTKETVSTDVDKMWSESLSGSKTTSVTDVEPTPDNFTVFQDTGECPDAVFDLSWDNGDYSHKTLDIERDDGSGFNRIATDLTAGTTSYRDTGATSGTQAYRIRFSDWAWETENTNYFCF